MTRDDAVAFSTLLAGLAETFDVPPSATRTELYFRALEDLPLQAVQQAAGEALRHCRFFPKPAELRDFVTTTQTAGELAWLALLEAFQAGYRETVLPDDEITTALVRVFWGGAERARDWWLRCHDIALEARHKEFVARYGDYARQPEIVRQRLPGARTTPMLGKGRRLLGA